jgi:hypothetical protein
MKTTKLLSILAALLASSVSQAQQNLQPPQPTPQPHTQIQTTPCAPTPPPPRKPGWLEKKAKALACQQNKAFCDLPSSASEFTGGTPETKPCPISPALPTKVQPPVPPATTPGPTSPAPSLRATYVCPPKTTLIPGTPYCLTGDHSTVDAIPLPPSLAAPTPVPSLAPNPQPTTKPTKDGSAALRLRAPPLEGAFLSPYRDNILDRPILGLSDSDYIDGRTACEGIAIFGAPGSGKSSCSGRQLAIGLLSTPKNVPKTGGLILTAKAEETQNWLGYARECGRENDVILFNPESGHSFDFLHYEWTRKGRSSRDLESIIDLFSSLLSNGKKQDSHGDNLFFERATEQLMRNVIVLIDLANEPVSIVSIDRVIKSLPTNPAEYKDEVWQESSHCAQLVNKVEARQESLSPEQWSDLKMATQYMFGSWPALDERPRTSIAMTWAGMADRFLFSPYNQLFCSGTCTFTPEMTTHDGKIIICDFPLLECGHETGRTVNVLMKLAFQRAWLRRNLNDSPNLCFLWQDEAQYFLTRRDNFAQQTFRGYRVANILLTQNILNISEELGETQPGSRTKSLLGNIGTKIFHQQNDTETNQYASDQIGREYRYIDNFSGGGSTENNQTHFSSGGSRQLAHILEPIEFTRLTKPDADNPLAQAIVYQSGKTFNATKSERNAKGSNYLSVFFSRA